MDELDFYRRVAVSALGTHLDAVLQGALEAASELTGAGRAALVVAGPAGEPSLHAQRGGDEEQPGLSRSVLRTVLATGDTIRLENALDAPEYAGQPSVQSLNLLSVLAVPLSVGDQVVGALYLDSVRVSGIFTPAHQQVVERFAEHLAPQLARVRETARLEARVRSLEQELTGADGRLLGESPLVLTLRSEIRQVAASDAPVLITGESGTGKELVAQALHAASGRSGPLVTVNCGALPSELLESELFGHAAGAFTGAKAARKGRFAAADGGTIFLDEIGELPATAQASLLRVLESGELQVVGADHPKQVSVRVVAATNRDLEQEARAGTFREDLYYRLSVVQLEVPPLRARGEDVLLLAEHFLSRFGRAEDKQLTLSPEARALLQRHRWPGNVRELLNALRRAALFAQDTVRGEHLPAAVTRAPDGDAETPPTPTTKAELDAAKAELVEELENRFVLQALERADGNVARAARETGLHRSVVHRILKRIRE